jgi:hypothetical protein
MMDPVLELQGAIVARLEADTGLTNLVGDRIFDGVPAGAKYPYVSMGPSDTVSDDVDCITGFEIAFQIDAWSDAVGFPEVRRIAEAVRRALLASELSLAENALVTFEYRQTRVMRDRDGLTSHAVITFTAFVEQP